MDEFYTFRRFSESELIEMQKEYVRNLAEANYKREQIKAQISRLQDDYKDISEKGRTAERNLSMISAEMTRRATNELING